MAWEYKHWRIVQKSKKEECQLCKSKKSLVIHHVDEDTHNSAVSNLLTLCSSCHIRSHRFGNSIDFIVNNPKRGFPVHLTVGQFDKKSNKV